MVGIFGILATILATTCGTLATLATLATWVGISTMWVGIPAIWVGILAWPPQINQLQETSRKPVPVHFFREKTN